jgi:hypothetical protein
MGLNRLPDDRWRVSGSKDINGSPTVHSCGCWTLQCYWRLDSGEYRTTHINISERGVQPPEAGHSGARH